jgi:hypothetical protein
MITFVLLFLLETMVGRRSIGSPAAPVRTTLKDQTLTILTNQPFSVPVLDL